MSLLTPRPAGPLVAKFQHEMAPVKLRIQAFLTVRDADRKVALVRLEDQPELWRLPGENVLLNEDPAEAARRVAKAWFASPLDPRLVDVQSYPATGGDDDRWYLILIYEATAPADIKGTPDTQELRFVPPGGEPAPTYGDHASVFARLRP